VCAAYARDLFAIAKFLFYVSTGWHLGEERERERDARNASSSKRLCPFTGNISSMYSDNFEPIYHDN